MRRVCDVLFLESNEPATYAEAMVIPDSEAWLEAMRSELKSMDENQVWDLADLPPCERSCVKTGTFAPGILRTCPESHADWPNIAST